MIFLTIAIIYEPLDRDYKNRAYPDPVINLSSPELESEIPLEEAIYKRRSIRNYGDDPLTFNEVSQLLWAAQGITDHNQNLRSAPSAGALYPLSIYIAVRNVENIEEGMYKYSSEKHILKKVKEESMMNEIYNAGLKQSSIKDSAVTLIITANYETTERVYGKRAERYVHMEAGHAGQNIYLQAEALNLGTVAIGAFNDEKIKEVIDSEEAPLYIFPMGKK